MSQILAAAFQILIGLLSDPAIVKAGLAALQQLIAALTSLHAIAPGSLPHIVKVVTDPAVQADFKKGLADIEGLVADLQKLKDDAAKVDPTPAPTPTPTPAAK